MRLLAGPLEESILDQGGDDSNSVAGSTEASQEASQTVSTSAPVPKISLSARLGEVALYVSGRSAPVWWPAEVRLTAACISNHSPAGGHHSQCIPATDTACQLCVLSWMTLAQSNRLQLKLD